MSASAQTSAHTDNADGYDAFVRPSYSPVYTSKSKIHPASTPSNNKSSSSAASASVHEKRQHSRNFYLLLFVIFILFIGLFLLELQQFRLNLVQNDEINDLIDRYKYLIHQSDRGRQSENISAQPLIAQSIFESEERRLPNCLIIGARKSGTRALLEALSLHPHIRTARFEVRV
jgi:hypothetical protein